MLWTDFVSDDTREHLCLGDSRDIGGVYGGDARSIRHAWGNGGMIILHLVECMGRGHESFHGRSVVKSIKFM